MEPVGPRALDASLDAALDTSPDAWPGVELVEPLTGGARNPVWLARRGGERLVVRRSGRAAASLDWELDLLAHLARHGIGVPQTLPAGDGRRHVAGVMVQRFVPASPPASAADWRRVVDTLAAVHRLTAGWPQRPGFASARTLLTSDRGGDVRLDLMPHDDAAAVRAAWRPVLTGAGHRRRGVGSRDVLGAGARVRPTAAGRAATPARRWLSRTELRSRGEWPRARRTATVWSLASRFRGRSICGGVV